MSFDFRVLDALQKKRNRVLDRLMPLLSDSVVTWYVLAFVMLLMERTRETGMMAAASLGMTASVCNLILKHVFQRQRPCDVNQNVQMLVARPKDYSFPSCHTAASFAAVTALCLSVAYFVGFAFLPASLIAFSRIYLYVH